WIARVAPRAQNVPHGRFYAALFLQDSRGNEIGALWAGYITNVVPVSVPALLIGEGMIVVARVGQSNSGVATRIVFDVDLVQKEPAGAGSIFFEPMYSGPGDRRNVALGDPAAGADYAQQTVFSAGGPGKWTAIGFTGQVVAAATVVTRVPRVEIRDLAGAVVDMGPPAGPYVASQTRTYR